MFYLFTASSENSFSSDSSHDYCVPPENISPPEPPAHMDDYDEVEGIYVEVRQEQNSVTVIYFIYYLRTV